MSFQEIVVGGTIYEFPSDMSDDDIMSALEENDLISRTSAQMSMSVFDSALSSTLSNEGGYVNDPDDPGGETNFGISKRSYPHLDIASLTEEQARSIYKRDFWDKPGYGRLPDRIAQKVFDTGVNVGTSRATKMLQEVVGSKADGIIGPKTLAAVEKMDEEELLQAFVARQKSYYEGIASRRKESRKFLRGWLARAEKVPAAMDGQQQEVEEGEP